MTRRFGPVKTRRTSATGALTLIPRWRATSRSAVEIVSTWRAVTIFTDGIASSSGITVSLAKARRLAGEDLGVEVDVDDAVRPALVRMDAAHVDVRSAATPSLALEARHARRLVDVEDRRLGVAVHARPGSRSVVSTLQPAVGAAARR